MSLFRDSWNVWRRKVDIALGGSVEPVKAEDVTYDGTSSGLVATNVQGAIDEVNAKPIQLDTVTATPESSVTLASGTFTSVASVVIEAGTYLILGHVRFGTNGTGVRTINIGASGWNGSMDITSAVQDALTTSNTWIIVTVPNTATYHLNAYQNSGGNLTVDAIRMEAIKLK